VALYIEMELLSYCPTGFGSQQPRFHLLIRAVFLLTYLVNLAGNSMLVGLVWADPQLHSPMYFFLSQLAVLDMGLVCITLPQALVHALTQHRAIPFARCMAQLFIYLSVSTMEGCLLAALCLKIVAASWAVVIPHALLHSVMTARLRYCSNRLPHYFCHLQSLLRLSCTRPFVNELVLFTEATLVVGTPCAIILASYVCIGVAVGRLRSAQALRKALSTCGSHLTVVLLTYGTVAWLYFHPDSSNTPGQKQQVTFFYTSVVPTLNPLIYSLRNKDVAAALRRVKRKVLAQC
uniref:G-protein coupled receptors family 1 profile domain-containing protein n=1 Tax=Pelodiscus sinensis TaxID=13735 RepID=K7FTY0_PELSI